MTPALRRSACGSLLLLALWAAAPAHAQSGTPGPAHLPFELPFDATDVVFDAPRGLLYATSAADQRVYFVDLATGLVVRHFSFPWTPEHLAITPDGSRLYVTLLTRSHSPYWWDGDHFGHIAGFDLDRQVKDRQFQIAEDPFGIAATSNGRLVISSGSGQWTHIHVFSATNGALLSTASRTIRERSYVTLHPDEDAVYTSGGTSYPQDLRRWELTPGGGIAYAWDSIYHGGVSIGGKAWITPDGSRIVSQGGGVFSLGGDSRTTDLQHLGVLEVGSFDDLAIDPLRRALVVAQGRALSYFNLDSLLLVDEAPTAASGAIDFVGLSGLQAYTLTYHHTHHGPDGQLLESSPHLIPNGDTNTPPSADFVFDPPSGWTTNTQGELDASPSQDAESALLHRWDLDDDGVWESDFDPSAILGHRFPTAGTKFVRLQVKDDSGAVDDRLRTVDVTFANDPGSPGPVHPSFVLPFEADDVAFDPVRPYAYVSSRSRKEVHFVNLQSGFIEKSFTFDEEPESLSVTPDGSRLYAALLTGDHGYYRFQNDGYIASFDLALQEKDRQYYVPLDPFDLLATSNGQLVIMPGSGQWSEALVVDGATGAVLSSTRIVRQRTRANLHPSESIVYAANNGLSPSDIERYDLAPDGTLTRRWDSIYHGDHRMSGNVWVAPSGDFLITRGGDVFSAGGDSRQTDMIYQRSLHHGGLLEAVAFDPVRKVIVAASDDQLLYFNLQSLEPIGQTTLPGDIAHAVVRGLEVLAVEVDGGETRIQRLDHPLPNGDTDRLPVASVATPTGPLTTQQEIHLDASASVDEEGGLLYRWDLDGDGEWDTGFLSHPIVGHGYDTAGTRVVTLQVKDSAGFVTEVSVQLDIVFEPDPGMEAPPNEPFVLGSEDVTDAVFDPHRPMLYVTRRDARELLFVDVRTGRIEQIFHFNQFPERLSITPDGSRLFLGLTVGPLPYFYGRDPQEGYIASFDLAARVKDRQYRVDVHPFDLLALAGERLVVSSGAGRGVLAFLFDGVDGTLLDSSTRVSPRLDLTLHPSGSIVYGATNFGSSDLVRFDITPSDEIVARWNANAFRSHRVAGRVWASPLGDAVFTGGGDVFSADGDSRETDLRFITEMSATSAEALVFDEERGLLFTGHPGEIRVFNLRSYEDALSLPAEGDVHFLGMDGATILALVDVAGEKRVLRFEHPLPNAAEDQPPVARVDVTPPSGATTLTDVVLDASASSDDGELFFFRWDLDDDGSWDTPYTTDPVVTQRYPTAGTKFVRLRMKDGVGQVDEVRLVIDVAFEPDPGQPPPAQVSFELPFDVRDALFDPVRPRVYVTREGANELHVVDLTTGFIVRTFTFAEMPDRMSITPDASQLFVGLQLRPHSCCWWEDDQEGFLARFDLDALVKDAQLHIDTDPYGLAATADGRVVVTSGSGQWTDISVFDGDTGALLGRSRSIRERSSVSLHPDGDRVYTAGGTSYPQDIHRWNLEPGPSGGITRGYDSIYHGTHFVGDEAWVSPRGDVVISLGGNVFNADGSSRLDDIQFQRALSKRVRDIVWSEAKDEFATVYDRDVVVYDMTTYAVLQTFQLPDEGEFIGRVGDDLLVLLEGGNTTPIEVLQRGP